MNGDLKCLACPGPFCHGDTQHAPLCCGVGKHCVHGAGGVYECDVGTRVPACMESVHELRGTTHADAVMMLTSSTTQCPAFSPPLGCISNAAFCGLSYLTVNRSSPNSSMLISPESAYGLVNVGGYAPFAFAHELGHILGSQHDIGSYAGTNYTLPAYSYSYGYYWVLDPNNFPGVDSFQTIMGPRTLQLFLEFRCSPTPTSNTTE
ncbi:MAG: hypothetical protein HYR83_10760 [Planctomycetes bacterium]|nr:hypothetical protein [Planctomycetota bacterium]